MTMRNLAVLRACLPIGLSLALGVVACGGSDAGDKSNTGGTSATSSGGSSTSTAGGTSKAGSTGTAGSTSTAGSTGTAGSGSGPSGGLDTGLPGDATLSSLTDTQYTDLCKKFDDFYSSGPAAAGLKDVTCRLGGFLAAAFAGADTDAAARAACKSAYDSCLTAPAETTTDKCTKPTGTCTATVAELEACSTDSANAVQQLSSTFPSCADLTLADLMGMDSGGDTTSTQPASCTTLSMKCPSAPMPPSGM